MDTPSAATSPQPEASGLSSQEAEALLKQVGPNAVADIAAKPVRRALGKLWAPIPWMLESAILLQLGLGDAIGWNALTVALAAAAGPTIGALILSVSNWRWLFAASLPLALAALLAARALPAVAGTGRRPDSISMALNAGLFGALVIGAEELPTWPMLACFLLAASALILVALLRRELSKSAPLIPLDLLCIGSFRISVIASVCCFTGQTAGMVALPFYLQHGLGQTPLMTGLYMTPWPVAVAIAASIAGKLADRMSTAWLCAGGGLCLAIGLAVAAWWPLHGDPRPLAALTILCGVGFGLFQVPNNRNMFLAAPRKRSGAAGGMQGTARLTGQTAGAVLMTMLFTWSSIEAAPRIGLAIGAVLTLAAGLVSMLRSVEAGSQS